MTMTLGGRISTRLVLMSTLGLMWTFAMTGLLPRPDSLSVRGAYQVALIAAIATNVIGFAWEVVYHLLQQLRWEKDWPPLLGLGAGALELWPVWEVIARTAAPPPGAFSFFVWYFASTWVVVWLAGLGPLGALLPRWRFEGGSFGRRPGEALVPFVALNGSMAIAVTVLWAVWP